MTLASIAARNLGDSLTQTDEEFFHLVSLGDESKLTDYLKHNITEIDFSKRNEQGNTALELAIRTKNDAIISLLLSTGKFLPLDETLCFATEYGYQNGIDLIFQHLSKPRLRFFKKRHSTDLVLCSDDLSTLRSHIISTTNDDIGGDDEIYEDVTNIAQNDIAYEDMYEDYDLVMDSCFSKAIGDSKGVSDEFSRISDYKFEDPSRQRKNSLYYKKAEDNEYSTAKTLICLKDPISILRKAAISENFQIAQKLINSGVFIPEELETDKRRMSMDSLQDTEERIQNYRALSTATYISLIAEDPFRKSFERSKQFMELAHKYPENKEIFQELSAYCSEFAVGLLNECKSADEVRKVLCQDKDFIPVFSTVRFGRLHLAVHYGQKQFIAHPSCQHVVSTQWLNGLPQWNQWHIIQKVIHVITQALLMILFFVPYIICPNSRLSASVNVPMNRFVYSVTCYCFFLGTLLTTIIMGKYENELIYYIALTWMLTHMLKLFFCDFPIQTSHFLSFWNVYDIIMAALFISSSILHVVTETSDTSYLLVFQKGLFSIATILAFLRVLQWFHMHRTLGPFIVSLRKILMVVVELLVVFSILYIAFTVGLYTLYSGSSIANNTSGRDFSSLISTVTSLYWALYGYGESAVNPIKYGKNETSYQFTDWVGNSLWGLFHIATVIILLNLLIAMMTNAFQRIQDNCDVEWKFARTQLWMSYFEEGNAIPPPFNIFIFLKNIFRFFINWEIINKQSKQLGRKKVYEDLNVCEISTCCIK